MVCEDSVTRLVLGLVGVYWKYLTVLKVFVVKGISMFDWTYVDERDRRVGDTSIINGILVYITT